MSKYILRWAVFQGQVHPRKTTVIFFLVLQRLKYLSCSVLAQTMPLAGHTARWVLQFFFNNILDHLVFQAQISIHLFQLVVLSLELPEPFQGRNIQTTEFGFPFVKFALAYAVLAR